MLIVSRKDAESIEIRPTDGVDPQMTLADLFEAGPIEVKIFSSGNNRVKMGVKAPDGLSIWRKEPADTTLVEGPAAGRPGTAQEQGHRHSPEGLENRASCNNRNDHRNNKVYATETSAAVFKKVPSC